MPRKNFKPPIKPKASIPPKKPKSLTDAQYEEIFTSVINAPKITPQNAPLVTPRNAASPTVAEQPPILEAASPKESASVENSQKSEKEKNNTIINKNTDTTLSTLNSDEITKNAVCSTPEKVFKPKTFHQALKSLKQKICNDSFSDVSINDSLNMSLIEAQYEGPLSQPPKKLNRRERLLWLQERRGGGLYVECGKVMCRKWRWTDQSDPAEIPEYWTCDMNSNKEMASCNIPEKPIPVFLKNDMIQNIYTAGSIVWAKVPGYPWWPAMVDDCPDTEQYYWVNNPLFQEPDWYHVVFFDTNEVTRSWILVKDLRTFKNNPNLDTKTRMHNKYKHRMQIAKTKATHALTLSIKERLSTYSFISLWVKDLPDFSESDSSDSDESSNDPEYQKVISNDNKRRKKYNSSSDNKKLQAKRNRTNSNLSLNETTSVGVCGFRNVSRNALKTTENTVISTKKPKSRPKKVNQSISTRRQSVNSLNESTETPRDTQKTEHVFEKPQNLTFSKMTRTKKTKFFTPPIKKNLNNTDSS